MTTIKGGDDAGNGGDGTVVEFPKTAEERRALRKAKEDLEKQRLVDALICGAGGDQALFHTRDGVAYADLIVAGHRETWSVRSKQFRYAYLRYLQQQSGRLVGEEQPLLALVMQKSMSKSAVNHAIDDFERRAICSTITCTCASPVTTVRFTSIFATTIGRLSASRLGAGAWLNFPRCDFNVPTGCSLSCLLSGTARSRR
jgi:hypothetical protein